MACQSKVFYVLPIVLTYICISSYFFKKQESSIERFNIDQVIQSENLIPVAIIGSGPAGLSSALYIARAGIKPVVFSGPNPCGQLTQTTFIENWPGREKVLGIDLMHDVQKQAESFGSLIVHDTVTYTDFSQWPFVLKTEEGRQIKALSVILATGAHPKQLAIPGEKEFWGKGVTTCAVCDAPFFVGKEVVIVGGGDSAAEQVFQLAPYVKKVTVLVRSHQMRACPSAQERILSYKNVTIEYNKEVKQIYGDDGVVNAVEIYDNSTKKSEKRSVDGVFLAIGHIPNTKLFAKDLKIDHEGYVLMKERSQQTYTKGVFAAGEIQDRTYRQAAVASGEGIKAALDTTSFLYEIGFNSAEHHTLEQNISEMFFDQKAELQEISLLQEFNTLLTTNKGLVIIDFYSQACPGCVRILPALQSLAFYLKDAVTVVKCNTADALEILQELKYNRGLQVRSVPAILLFKNGTFVARTNAVMSRKELFSFVNKYL